MNNLLIGLVILLVLFPYVLIMESKQLRFDAKDAIELCEAELPRNLSCKLIITAEVAD